MENIVRVFRPWIDAHPEVDIYWTAQTGWVCYSCFDGEVVIRENIDRKTMLTVLAAWAFDQSEDLTWKGAVIETVKRMRPYLKQLPEKDSDTFLTALAMFLRFDEEMFPRFHPAPS